MCCVFEASVLFRQNIQNTKEKQIEKAKIKPKKEEELHHFYCNSKFGQSAFMRCTPTADGFLGLFAVLLCVVCT